MIPEISNDHPLEIFVKSTSAAPIIRPASERSGRRLADQIIDVMTEELTLRPVDDPSSAEAVNAAPMPTLPQMTCLNQTALFAACTAFATLIVLCTVLLTYLFKDLETSIKSTRAFHYHFFALWMQFRLQRYQYRSTKRFADIRATTGRS
ncbi:hypothetical protein ANCCAN_07136 [Ancylostoma caninum]|uniref:Uncharacterized protein n=1 Tax=Ancylostoma caninum TaxID=29170 RepID=A0A368GR17_ANCCA|nr:hypothetical protein ANCCAN_07136 [Ancylostoma caninum]